LRDRKTRRIFTRLVSTVAAIVVFVTTYALVLPAITMEAEAQCGIEAHQHDDSCYEDVLVCDIPESSGHHHDESCYSVDLQLICRIDEHQHDTGCYDENGKLTCGKAEHVHSEENGCYKEVRDLVCGQEENSGHKHDGSCYEKVLTCGKEVHTHSQACYRSDDAEINTESAAVSSTGSAASIETNASSASTETVDREESGAPVSTAETDIGNTDNIDNTGYTDSTGAVNSGSSEASGSSAGSGSSTVSGKTTNDEVSDEASALFTSSTTSSASGTSTVVGTASGDAYVPVLDSLDFDRILTDSTGLYYFHAKNGETVPENSVDITDWKPLDEDTVLAPADIIRVYLAYSIPAGSLNGTNAAARYRLPSNIHLSDSQMESINSNVNGISKQYVNMDTLEITDPAKYSQTLGVEAIEGTRKPSDNLEDYFAKHKESDGQEYISATVKVEDVYDTDDFDAAKNGTRTRLGTDLVFTFTPYSVRKNQHTYDSAGKPTSAGQKIQGWMTFDLRTDQIDFETIDVKSKKNKDSEQSKDDQAETDRSETDGAKADRTKADTTGTDPVKTDSAKTDLSEKEAVEKEATIVFVPKTSKSQPGLDIDEISQTLHLRESAAGTGSASDGRTEVADKKYDSDKGTESEEKSDSDKDVNPDTAGIGDRAEKLPLRYPALTFRDSITASMGALSTDTENGQTNSISEETELTVYVEADEGTFPEGTTMKLAAVKDMDTVASAVEEAVTADDAVSNKTCGFHAVDISFWNTEGSEIEPLKPIRVSIKSESIKQAVEDTSTAPVVVHVEEAKTDKPDEDTADSRDETVSVDDAHSDADREDLPSEDESAADSNEKTAEAAESAATIVEIKERTGSGIDQDDNTDTLTFEAGNFSVYAIVYTVDFHWEVNGKKFEFSIPGGGFVSLEHLVELLGINDAASTENGVYSAGQGVENTSDNAGEESGDINNTTTCSASELNALEISEETIKFVEEVDSVVFSSPELVWVGKVGSDNTIGGLKEANELDCEYSLELTEKQIEEINAQTVEAGDWALISMQPFSSEETLTVTMKNGETFTISVTDAQLKKTVISDSGETWKITVTYGGDAQIPADSELEVREITEEDENYSSLCENAQNKLQEEGKELKKPVLFDISIVNNGEKIEPAENSNVKVDVKLVRSALRGIYTDEETPLLINDEPMKQKNGDIVQDVQVIHQLKDGEIELVDTEDVVGEENVTSSFTTDSFSDWLLFLDETVEYITIGVNDTLTLRPYSKWVWKSSEELEEYEHYEWKVPQNSNVISFSRERKYDDQLREEYYYHHGKATQKGKFDLQLVDGDIVKHTIHVTVIDDVPDIPETITDTADIKINLFDYDINTTNPAKSGVLDARGNTASNPYSNTVNNNHDLKFLGWGGGNVSGWSINNYSQDIPNPGIVKNRLTNGYPKLTTGSNQSLDYLFNTSSNTSSVKAYPGVNGLFQYQDGYYFYNSNSNYAYYNSSNNTFTLYDHTYSQWTSGTGGHNAKPIGFFPFHRYDSYLKEGDGMNFNTNLNHHFGMDMTVDFEIPSDGLDDNGNPIIFEFSGDDDMWVFVDDNLVLDVGGIHQPVTGKINFSSDKVEVFGSRDTTITKRFQDAQSPKAWEIGDGKPHTMKIFYLERGGCDSNLSIKFNTPIRYGKGKLSLVKKDKNKNTPLQFAKFGIWNNEKCQGDPIVEYTTDVNGKIDFGEFVLKSATDTFFLKEIKQPDGYIRDPEVYQIKPRLNNGEAVKDSNGYVILDVFDKDGHTLTKVENDSVVFPNTKIEKISIPAEKKWIGGSGGNATVTLTINRFKLIDKVKGFMIVKELWDEPDDYNFEAVYKITYPDGTQKTINYNAFSSGIYGIEDAVPGDYLIEEVVGSTAPNGYHMEHTSQSLNITLAEDGTALAFFKTSFARDKGKLFIKENVTTQGGNASDIDYSTVRYAVLNESGKKVTSVSHAQAAEGISLDLPVGTYSVKAVSVPDEPYNYEQTEQYVVSGNNRQNGTVLNNISITTNNQTRVDFNTKYVKLNNAQNCKWAIRDQYPPSNKPNYKTGTVDYPVGTKLMMTFQVPQNQVYDTDGTYDVTYNGQSLTPSKSNVQSNYEFEVEFIVAENAELVFRVNGISPNKNVTISGPRFEVVNHAPHTHSGRMMLSAKRPNTNTPLTLGAQNEATHPEAPTGKKYVKDSAWSETVVLNTGNNWKDTTTLKDLPATDEEGNKYYYYVASVQESGVPEGTVCSIDLDGEDILLIGKDLNNSETLSVTNTLTGSLKITKEVTVNRAGVTDHTKACPADGTYTFTITKDGIPIDQSPVELTVTKGVAISTVVDSLTPGTYRVTETQPTNGAELDKINGTETAQNYFDIVVQAGQTGNNAPNVTFTNNIVDTEIKVIKVEKDTQTHLHGAKFKLTRVDDRGNEISTAGEAYSSEKEVDSTTGELEFTGLKKGRYKLEETHVPDGYINTEQFYFFTIDKDGTGTLDNTVPHEMISPDSGNEFTIENEPGAALPNTGGPGTRLFTILGSVMICLAGVLLWRRQNLV